MRQPFILKPCAAALSVIIAGLAHTNLHAAENSGPSFALEEIVVTARKREETLMDAPVAVSAVSGEAMAKQGITELTQLNAKVPGLQMGRGPGTQNINIRGIGSGINRGFEQTVGLYVDGIYQSRSTMFTLAQFDMQQVEVLRGPQGTLFGKNTVAGAIKIDTATPSVGDELSGSFAIDYEPEHNTQRYTGVVGGSLTDTLAARLAVRSSSSDGYIENLRFNQDAPELDDTIARLTMSWEPTDNVVVTPKISYVDSDRVGSNAVNPTFDPALTLSTLGIPGGSGLISTLGSGPLLGGTINGLPFRASSDSHLFGNQGYFDRLEDSEHIQTEMLTTSVKVEWDIDDYTLTSLTAYVDYDRPRLSDGDQGPVSLAHNSDSETLEQISQEFRIASNFDGPVNFVAGVYYEEQELALDFDTTFDFTLGGMAPAYIASLGFPINSSVLELLGLPVDDFTIMNDFEQDTETLALFGELTIELSDEFTLDLGLRYSEDEKDAFKQAQYAAGHPSNLNILVTPDLIVADAARDADKATKDAAIQANAANVFAQTGSVEAANLYAVGAGALANHPHATNDTRTEYHLDPSIRLRWEYSGDGMAYLSYSEGYKSGGFNQTSDTTTVGGNPAPGFEFEDETVEAWELGVKQSFMDGRGRVSAALFHTELSDQQVTSFQTISFIVTNAASLTAQGIELEAQYLLTEDVEIGGSFAYLDNEYDSYPGAPCDSSESTAAALLGQGCSDDFSGQRSPFAPEYSGSIYANYTYDFNNWELNANVTASYKDEFFLNPDLNPNQVQDSYVKWDARVGLMSNDGVWEFRLYGRNLTDETTFTYSIDTPFGRGATTAYVDEPRIVGIQAKVNF